MERSRDGQPRSGPDRDLVRPISLNRLNQDRTIPMFRFGLGLISMIQISVRSYNSPRPSVRSQSKTFGPISQTRTGLIGLCSMRFTINAFFRDDIMLHPSRSQV